MDQPSGTSSIRLAAVDESNLDMAMQFVGQFYEHFQYPFEQNRKRALLAEFMADESLGRLWLITQAGVAVGYTIVAFSFSPRTQWPSRIYRRVVHRLFITQRWSWSDCVGRN